MASKKFSKEDIENFMNGRDPLERIVNIEYDNRENFVTIYYRNENDEKCVKTEGFYPFVFATKEACKRLCGGDRKELTAMLKKHKIRPIGLRATNDKGEVVEAVKDGYTVRFEAVSPMSYRDFLGFFKACGNPIFSDKYKKDESSSSFTDVGKAKKETRQYLISNPKDQFMIATGKRYFKGYNDYDECLRMIFDLETEGLDTNKDRIEKFGIRFNRPVKYKGKAYTFEKIYNTEGETKEEKDASELSNIRKFLSIIMTFQPDVITAHNGEAFDWCIIIGACNRLGCPLEELSKEYFNGKSIVKDFRETTLKLGGEVERFRRTIVPGTIVTDSLHAVRREQAKNSNMLEANLKYVTKFTGLKKENRVYVPGDIISEIGNDFEEKYAFNDLNGDWYIYDPNFISEGKESDEKSEKFVLVTRNELMDGYVLKSGKYIVDRYLLDDLWECDKVEKTYNNSNFYITKILPLPYEKCCTMGTATQWQALLLSWCYEHNLAVPPFGENRSFTGGLSRLLQVGYADNVAKFDYNSLYPSITLTWAISDEKDIDGVMLSLLEFVLTQREHYKKLKKDAGKRSGQYKEELNNFNGSEAERKVLEKKYDEAVKDFNVNDSIQNNFKTLGNSFFGSYGCPSVFSFGSVNCAERITCTGRQALRLMISHFSGLKYTPVVGDSFSGDTPLFLKYSDKESPFYNLINIRSISEIINEEKIETDELGREYDYIKKPYDILCRSGWVNPSYVYRHKTDKPIYQVSDSNRNLNIEITEDHSLFNAEQEKIKPSEITDKTKLEYYNDNKNLYLFNTLTNDSFIKSAMYISLRELINGNESKLLDLRIILLNASLNNKKEFVSAIEKSKINIENLSKTSQAIILYIKNALKVNLLC